MQEIEKEYFLNKIMEPYGVVSTVIHEIFIHLKSDEISKYSDISVEVLVVKISLLDLIVILTYCPPSINSGQWQKALNVIRREIIIIKHHGIYHNVIVLDNFNFPRENWNKINVSLDNEYQSIQSGHIKDLTQFMSKNHIMQLINEFTRHK